MRVLMHLEPVIYQGNPHFLVAHFPWAEAISRAVLAVGGRFALAANFEVCDSWVAYCEGRGAATETFPLDPLGPLAASNGLRSAYSKSLYCETVDDSPLVAALQSVRIKFGPELVVMTSQNNFARRAFEHLPILSIEQAPLPRLGQPVRTAFDPVGHQTGALLEKRMSDIRSRPLTSDQHRELRRLLIDLEGSAPRIDPRAAQARLMLSSYRSEGRIALLATQPPDWVTYEGAYQAIEPEGLLRAWSEALPAGWLGVPTYHPGFQISDSMERALSRACPRLRFLPQHLSRGMTEPLLSCADGIVTISSTSAMTALILGKRVVVVGRSPFNHWAVAEPCDLDRMVPLSDAEAESTLAFLTHRFSQLQGRLQEDPAAFASFLAKVIAAPCIEEWFLDTSDWSIDRARSLFNLQ